MFGLPDISTREGAVGEDAADQYNPIAVVFDWYTKFLTILLSM